MIKSLDPRINRKNLPEDLSFEEPKSPDQFQTFEVFHQKNRGEQHVHVGVVHAPNAEMAMLYAKEQYSRRGKTANLWVVKSAEIFATEYFDEDIFETTPEKFHRDPASYKVMDKIQAYKEKSKKQ